MKTCHYLLASVVIFVCSVDPCRSADAPVTESEDFDAENMRARWDQIFGDPNRSRQQIYLSDFIYRLPPGEYPAVYEWISQLQDEDAPGPDAENPLLMMPINNGARAAAFGRIPQQPGNDLRLRAFSILFSAWAVHDPEAAMEALNSSNDKNLQERVTQSILTMWIKDDWQAVIHWFADAEGEVRSYGLYLIVEEMATRNPFNTLDWVSKNAPAEARNELQQALFRRWGQTNPLEAISFATNELPAEEQLEAFKAIAQEWSATYPGEAIAWIQNQPLLLSDNNFLRNLIFRVSNTDALAALSLLETANDPTLNENVFRQVLSNWASQDIVKASEWFRSLPDGTYRNQAFEAMIYPWAQSDPVSLAEVIIEMPAQRSTQNAVQQVASQWAQFDPQNALEWAESLKNSNWRQMAVNQVTSAWVNNRPETAAAFIHQMENMTRRQELALQLVNSWANRNADDAWQWIEQFEPVSARQGLYENFLGSLANQNPQKAYDILNGLDNPGPKLFTSFGLSWSNNNLSAALRWLRSIEDPDLKRAAFEGIVQTWARYFPQQALEFSQTNFDATAQKNHLESILSTWSNENPGDAAAYISQHADLPNVNSHVRNVFSRWSNLDINAAIEWFKSLPDFPGKTDSFYNISYQWTNQDPQGAADFALDLPPGPQRRQFIRNLLSNMANSDPEGAFAFASKLTPVEEQREALQSVVSNWAYRSPSEAAAKVASLDESSTRQELLKQVASSYSNRDLTGAVEWMQTVENEEDQLVIFEALAGAWAKSSPGQALDYANEITDSERRTRTIDSILSGWSEADPNAAANYYLSLSPETLITISPQSIVRNLFRQNVDEGIAWINRLPAAREIRFSAIQGAVSQLLNDSKFEAAARLALRTESAGNGRNPILENTVRNWSEYDLDSVIEWLGHLQDENQIEIAFSGVINKWIERDASAAADFADTHSLGKSEQLAARLSQALTRSNPDQAFKWAMRLPDQQTRSGALQAVIPSFISRDPEQILKMISDSIEDPRERSELLDVCILTWAQRAPLAAANFLLGDRETDFDNNILSMAGSRWANSDLIAAVTWVEFQQDEERRWKAFRAISQEWMRQAPSEALEFLKNFSPEKRGSILPEIVGRLDEESKFGIAADYLMSETGNPDFYSGAQNLLTRWMNVNLDSAISWFQRLPESPKKAEVFQGIEDVWIRQHPESAVAYVAGLPLGQQRRYMIQRTFSKVADREPQVAFALAQNVTPDEDKKYALSSVVSSWSSRDSAAAAEKVLGLKQSPLRSDLLRTVAASYARRDFETALAWMKTASDENDQSEIYLGLASEWGRQSPEEALGFLNTLTDPAMQASALESILVSWSEKDVKAASEYLLTRDPELRAGINSFALAQNFFEIDADEAAKWIWLLPGESAVFQNALRGGIAGLQNSSRFQAASELSLKAPVTDDTNPFLRDAIHTWTEYDLKSAVAWTKELEDEIQLKNAYAGLKEKWLEANPDAATEFASQHGLD